MKTYNVSKVRQRRLLSEILSEASFDHCRFMQEAEAMHAIVNRLHKDKYLLKCDVKHIKDNMKSAFLRSHRNVRPEQYDELFAHVIGKV